MRRAAARAGRKRTPPARRAGAEASAERVLERIRRFCLSLPDVTEVESWGHPTFKVGGRTFAVFEFYRHRPCIAVKAEPAVQEMLIDDVRCFRTPYVGHQGWISLWTDGPFDWTMASDLIRGSHRLVAPRKLRAPKTIKA